MVNNDNNGESPQRTPHLDFSCQPDMWCSELECVYVVSYVEMTRYVVRQATSAPRIRAAYDDMSSRITKARSGSPPNGLPEGCNRRHAVADSGSSGLQCRVPADLERIMSASAAARRHQRLRSLRASFRRYGPTSSRLLLAGGGGSLGGGCAHEARGVCRASLAGLVVGTVTVLTVSRDRRHAIVATGICGSLQPGFDATARAGVLCVFSVRDCCFIGRKLGRLRFGSGRRVTGTHLDAVRHECQAVGVCAVSDGPRCCCRADKGRAAAVDAGTAAAELAAASRVLHSGGPVAPTPRLDVRQPMARVGGPVQLSGCWGSQRC